MGPKGGSKLNIEIFGKKVKSYGVPFWFDWIFIHNVGDKILDSLSSSDKCTPIWGKPVFNCNPGQLQQGGWDDLDTHAIKIVWYLENSLRSPPTLI